MTASRFNTAGYQVLTAQNGEEALRKIKEQKPDLIVSDLVMPEMGGWHFLENLRRDKNLSDIPVLITSALINESGEARNLELGDYYLAKPFDAQQLIQKAQELLESRKET